MWITAVQSQQIIQTIQIDLPTIIQTVQLQRKKVVDAETEEVSRTFYHPPLMVRGSNGLLVIVNAG